MFRGQGQFSRGRKHKRRSFATLAVCDNYKQSARVAKDHPKILDREVIINIPLSLSKLYQKC